MTRCLLDMCVHQGLLDELVLLGADAVRFSGLPNTVDPQVLEAAFAAGRIFITNDKGFGDLILRKKNPCVGAILVRLEVDVEQSAAEIAETIYELGGHAAGQFSTLDSSGLRSRKY